MAKTMTPAEFATEIGSDARTVRKFLRAEVNKVGKGSRHTIPADKNSLKRLTKQFNAWNEKRANEKAAKADENAVDENTENTENDAADENADA